MFSGLAVDLTPLYFSRDFRLLFIGQAVSSFGSMMTYVVLPWQMYQLTRSSFWVGMLSLTEFLPTILMGFLGGALADYVDRRRLVWLTELGMTLCCGALIANAMLPQPHTWVLFVIAALFATCNGLQRPSREALIPRLLPPELIPAAAALSSLRWSLSDIAGPALGGFLATKFGAALAYGLDGATFIFSLAMLWFMQAVPPPAQAERPSIKTLWEGLRYARSRPELMGTYLIDINAMFFGMPMALYPAMAENFGGAAVGLFYAMPAVGAFLASSVSGWTAGIHKQGLAITMAASIWGVAIIGFGLAENLWLALFWLALAGAGDMVSALFRITMWNQTIPDHLRGRLAGIEMISYTTGPLLGNAEAGLVASLFSIRTAVVSGGVLCVLGSAALAFFLPEFLRYDRRTGLAHKEKEEAAHAALLAGKN